MAEELYLPDEIYGFGSWLLWVLATRATAVVDQMFACGPARPSRRYGMVDGHPVPTPSLVAWLLVAAQAGLPPTQLAGREARLEKRQKVLRTIVSRAIGGETWLFKDSWLDDLATVCSLGRAELDLLARSRGQQDYPVDPEALRVAITRSMRAHPDVKHAQPVVSEQVARLAAGMFVGRIDDLARLDAAMSTQPGVVVQAVHGLGGIGKTTLAAHYAARHRRDFDVIWWITADSSATVDSGLAALATALQPQLTGSPLEVLREHAVDWLAAHGRWLVVLDNVTDPAHVQPLLARAVSGGHFLITTRRSTGWHGLATQVRLDVLRPPEARQLLTGILTHGRKVDPSELHGTAALCAELGYLPLAIEQAAAYIAETGLTPTAYLELLTAYPAAMYQQTAEGGDAQRTIARIWRMTLDQLTATPLAGQLLQILAFYAPAHIPRSLLTGLAAPPGLNTAIGRLAAYSLITTDGGDLAVHRLAQAVARTPDPDDPHRSPQAIAHAREQAVALLTRAAPRHWRPPDTWPVWGQLIPHVEALARHTDPGTDTPATTLLLSRAAAFLQNQGAVSRALPLFERDVAACARVLGDDHPDTLTARNNLAGAYREAGHGTQAIMLYERTVDDRCRVLGDDHPDTQASRNDLACAYWSAGNLAQAIPLYEGTVAACTRTLGEDHPRTLASRQDLAGAYESAGDLARAIPLYESTLAAYARVLGPDHPDTLTSRNDLAGAYETSGNLTRAITLFEETLAARRRALGDHHPQTLTTCNDLACAYQSAGDLERAIPLLEATLDNRRRVLGKDHPDTLISRSNLACAYRSGGQTTRAIALYTTTLTDCTRLLGADYPDTLTVRNNLACAYQSAGDLERAIPLLEATLNDQRRVLGKDHPDTLASVNNLACAYQSNGRIALAIALQKTTVADCTRVLGPHHPSTIAARVNLAYAHMSAGEVQQAQSLATAVLADAVRLFGQQYPLTQLIGHHFHLRLDQPS